MLNRLPAVIALVTLFAIPVRCQPDDDEPDTYRFSGRVVNRSGVAVAGAKVDLDGGGDNSPMQTGPDGRFSFPRVRNGLHYVDVDKPGFVAAQDGGFVDDKDVDLRDVVLESKASARLTVLRSKRLPISDVDVSGPNKTVVITFSDGTTFRPPKVDYQASCTDPQLSDDHQAAGWLVESFNPSTTYPIAFGLIIFTPGKPLRAFSADPVFWAWKFVAGGKQVAYCENSLHPFGNSPPHCALRDVATGRIIDDTRRSDHPEWMAGLTEE